MSSKVKVGSVADHTVKNRFFHTINLNNFLTDRFCLCRCCWCNECINLFKKIDTSRCNGGLSMQCMYIILGQNSLTRFHDVLYIVSVLLHMRFDSLLMCVATFSGCDCKSECICFLNMGNFYLDEFGAKRFKLC